jgi:HlyD family secretion protein
MNQLNGAKLDQKVTITSPPIPKKPTEFTTSDLNGNGSKLNGNGNRSNSNDKFDQPVILRQSHRWSRAILWTIIGVTTFGVIWASVAKIEQAVPAQGKLEPQDAVKEVQVPVSGVVKEVLAKDGQTVKKGDLLLRLDPTVSQAQLTSLEKIRATLIKENQFYRSVMSNSSLLSLTAPTGAQLALPKEIASLTESRKALLAENLLYRTQLGGDSTGANLTPEQRVRLRFATTELESRVASAELEVGQLQRQLEQNTVQLINAKSRFRVEQGILKEMTPLAAEGAVPRIQFYRQQQEARTRQAEVDQLIQEQGRLELQIAQGKQKIKNTVALSQKDLTTQIATNEKQLAEIDSQLNKLIVENDKKLAEIDSQLSQTKQNLNYQDLRAPVGGTIFDMKASGPGFVTNTTEPVIKIVPDDTLIAKVYLTNKDIGFVREGMTVDVRIDSFPFSEFGDVKGELIWIGDDALPPDQVRPFYSFPAKVKLKQQTLLVNDRKVPLQSGMSVSVNILVRERTVMSIFTDLFTDKTESLKTVR